jgi:hypothetical protein
VSNGAKNWCASYLSDTESKKKYQEIRAKSAKFEFLQVA